MDNLVNAIKKRRMMMAGGYGGVDQPVINRRVVRGMNADLMPNRDFRPYAPPSYMIGRPIKKRKII